MRVLVSRSDARPFEVDRFSAAWERACGDSAELVFVSPSTSSLVVSQQEDFDGLLMTGGPDVEPRRFGAEAQPGIVLRTDPARDALDLELLERAARRGWPVLAVCYGCQLLNVAYGGTLIQDLDRAGKPGHTVSEPKDAVAHDALVDERARFLPLAGRRIGVNSRHHQGIAQVGRGLAAVAHAPDGVIEAIEADDSARFVLGVQWHPENMPQPEHVAIFRAFRSACLAHSAAASLTDPGPRTLDPCP
jgi:putative glutamine amidotransferase